MRARIKGVYKNHKTSIVKNVLIIINITLIIVSITSSFIYSTYVKKRYMQAEKIAFSGTIESMKQVSYNYLKLEQGYVKDWAGYIQNKNMTIDEALEYIRQTNMQSDRYAHIVDMDTYEAYCAYEKDTNTPIDIYKKIIETNRKTDDIFAENMKRMFENEDEGISVLGKYRSDTQLNVISVGTRVNIKISDNESKAYLLLRIIPVESMRKIWVFPAEYKSAEVGIITKTGSYVVQSNAMKSVTFLDFIRAYNYSDDYNKINELEEQLENTDKDLLCYKDSKGEDCYWYYSSFGDNTGLDILGYIPVSSLRTYATDWIVVLMTCGVLALLSAIDGAYVMHINKRLKETAIEARQASEAKTKFLSTMSHDIRTPMNAVMGMMRLAGKHADNPEYVTSCVDKALLAGEHLMTLINDILDISKVESGNMVINPSEFSIEHSFNKLINIIKPQADSKDIKFEAELKDITYDYIMADELRLNQIYINLLNNAVKYTQTGGSVKMSVWEEVIDESDKMSEQADVYVIFKVQDTGMGMSDEFQNNMYTMFSRETDGRINKIQGTGLGLAIVKQMTDIMHGTIECDSKQGMGTEFKVKIAFPAIKDKTLEAATNESEKDLKEQINNLSGMKVLVAEDNELNWDIIHEVLKEYNINSFRAKNGQECVDMLENSKDYEYDLVFMDIQMPVMDGFGATKIIRNSDREYVKHIKVIAMTADAFAENVKECLMAGMDDHIAKPIDIKKIEAALIKVREENNAKDN